MENIPADTDFGLIEKLFPPDRPDNPAISRGRNALIRKWAQEDPKGATDYLIRNSERLEPGKASIIATVIVMKSTADGLEWAQQFPAGPYFDAAVMGVVPYLKEGYPPQAHELVSQMSDPTLKAKCFEMIKYSQAALDLRLKEMEQRKITPK